MTRYEVRICLIRISDEEGNSEEGFEIFDYEDEELAQQVYDSILNLIEHEDSGDN